MAANFWKIRVTSAVFRTSQNGRRVRVVPGDYTVTTGDAQTYEFTLAGTPTFKFVFG